MNTITPINFKAKYPQIKKVHNTNQETIQNIQKNVKKASTNNLFQKGLAFIGLSTIFTNIAKNKNENQIKETEKDNNEAELLKQYLRDSSEINDLEIIKSAELLKNNPSLIEKTLKELVYCDHIEKMPINLRYLIKYNLSTDISLKDQSFLMDCIQTYFYPPTDSPIKFPKKLLEEFYELIKKYKQTSFNLNDLDSLIDKERTDELKDVFEIYGEPYIYVAKMVSQIGEYWGLYSNVMYSYGFKAEEIARYVHTFNNHETAHCLLRHFFPERYL